MSLHKANLITGVNVFKAVYRGIILQDGVMKLLNEDVNSLYVVDEAVEFLDTREYIIYQKIFNDALYRFDKKYNNVDRLEGNFTLVQKPSTNPDYVYTIGGKGDDNFFSVLSASLFSVKFFCEAKYGLSVCGYDDFVVFSKRKAILCVAIEKDEVRWEHDFTTSDVREVFGISGDCVIVQLKDNTLLGLDLNSGETLWQLPDSPLWYSKHPVTGKLLGLSYLKYEEIDPVKGERILRLDLEKEFKDAGVLLDRSVHTLNEHGMFFSSDYPYPCKFGRFDIEQKKIDFVHTMDLPKGVSPYAPIFHNGRYYIRDTEKNLHIYEQS